MKQKGKKKSKHDLPSLDFVTALSVEECRERLLLSEPQTGNEHLQRFDIADDQHFTVEWLVVSPPRKYINLPMLKPQEDLIGSVKYEGGLSKTNNGTHIQVIPIPQKAVWPRILMFFVLPVGTILIVLAGLSHLDVIGGSPGGFLSLLWVFIVVTASPVIVAKNQNGDASILVRQTAKQITEWLHSTLYVPLEKVFENNEVKVQKEK